MSHQRREGEPNANTFLQKCPTCDKVHRRRKTKQVPTIETYLEIKSIDPNTRKSYSDAEHTIHFTLWVKQGGLWNEGGEYRVRLDGWDDTINEGEGGYIRNPLLEQLHWHWCPPICRGS